MSGVIELIKAAHGAIRRLSAIEGGKREREIERQEGYLASDRAVEFSDGVQMRHDVEFTSQI